MFSDPVKIVEQCGIQVGQDVADFGSGTGAYSIAVSKALMSTGRVYAVDVQKDLLTKLKNTAAEAGLYNIEVVWGNAEKLGGSKLRDNSIDLVLLSNVMFQMEDRPSAIKECKRVLKPGGRVLVVDWADSFGGIGPQPVHLFKKEDARDLFEKSGFHVDREIAGGSHHYGFIFKKL